MPGNSSRLKAVWLCFGKAKAVWLTAGAFCVAGIYIFLRGSLGYDPEQTIRITSLGFQVLGIYTVILEKNKTRSRFGLSLSAYLSKTIENIGHYANNAITWYKKWHLFRPNDVVMSVGAAECHTSLSLTLESSYQRSPFGPNPTVDAVAKALEEYIKVNQEQINQMRKETNEKLKHEAQSRQDENQNIREELKATATGGFHISMIGVFLLLIGVTLSTFSCEIAALQQ